MTKIAEPQVPTMLAIKRLGKYLSFLRHLEHDGVNYISTPNISKELGVHESQVRKDLALTGLEGKPKVGHLVTEAIRGIEHFLNVTNTTDAFLVGVGHLGTALLAHNALGRFEGSGIKIVAAFDKDPELIGTKVHGVEILPIDKFENLARRMHIHVGILTTTTKAAQSVADIMVTSGILAIWNFAPVSLSVPEETILETVELETSLAYISRKLKEKLHTKG